MVLKSGINSPVEVGSLSHYFRGFYTSQVVGNGISEPSTVFRSIFQFSEMLYKKDQKRQGAVAASSVQKRVCCYRLPDVAPRFSGFLDLWYGSLLIKKSHVI